MNFELYPYQEEFVSATIEQPSKRMLGVLPTGTGKTVCFLEVAKRMNVPTLILAHRDELIAQAVTRINDVWPEASVGVIKADRHETNQQLTVASVQSLYKKRLESLPAYGLIITDEAHHAAAPTYRRIYHRFGLLDKSPDKRPLPQISDNTIHLGVTATPGRADKKGLKSIFDTIIYDGKYPDFVPKYLSDLRVRGVSTSLDLSTVKVSRLTMDFSESDLTDTINTQQISSDILRSYHEFASDRKRTLVFCVSRKHAFSLYQLFQSDGIPSGYVDFKTPRDERIKTLEAFRDGDIRVLFNVMILTEGYDCPEIDCVLLARPTKYPHLLTQMIGRGTRRAKGKSDCLIIDVALFQRGNNATNVASLFSLKPSQLMSDKPLTAIMRESSEFGKQREPQDVDYSLQLSIDSIFEIVDKFRPKSKWHSAPATPKQRNLVNRELASIGEKPIHGLTRGQASALINEIFNATPATVSQKRYMKILEIEFEASISKQAASGLISAEKKKKSA